MDDGDVGVLVVVGDEDGRMKMVHLMPLFCALLSFLFITPHLSFTFTPRTFALFYALLRARAPHLFLFCCLFYAFTFCTFARTAFSSFTPFLLFTFSTFFFLPWSISSICRLHAAVSLHTRQPVPAFCCSLPWFLLPLWFSIYHLVPDFLPVPHYLLLLYIGVPVPPYTPFATFTFFTDFTSPSCHIPFRFTFTMPFTVFAFYLGCVASSVAGAVFYCYYHHCITAAGHGSFTPPDSTILPLYRIYVCSLRYHYCALYIPYIYLLYLCLLFLPFVLLPSFWLPLPRSCCHAITLLYCSAIIHWTWFLFSCHALRLCWVLYYTYILLVHMIRTTLFFYIHRSTCNVTLFFFYLLLLPLFILLLRLLLFMWVIYSTFMLPYKSPCRTPCRIFRTSFVHIARWWWC